MKCLSIEEAKKILKDQGIVTLKFTYVDGYTECKTVNNLKSLKSVYSLMDETVITQA